jgi:hypothetical protein
MQDNPLGGGSELIIADHAISHHENGISRLYNLVIVKIYLGYRKMSRLVSLCLETQADMTLHVHVIIS